MSWLREKAAAGDEEEEAHSHSPQGTVAFLKKMKHVKNWGKSVKVGRTV